MTNGLVVMTPSSIAYSGTSASINADGSVVFSACTSLSLNGVFTGDYDNYMIALRHVGSTVENLSFRLRASGTDASGANYTSQYLQATGANIFKNRGTGTLGYLGVGLSATQRSGASIYCFGPYLAQPTAIRDVSVSGQNSADLTDRANTHSLSTAYDGWTFLPQGSSNFTGLVTVFGFNQ